MLVYGSLETLTTEEHMQGMSIIARHEMRRVVYFMDCRACGCIHRLVFNSVEDESAWFNPHHP